LFDLLIFPTFDPLVSIICDLPDYLIPALSMILFLRNSGSVENVPGILALLEAVDLPVGGKRGGLEPGI